MLRAHGVTDKGCFRPTNEDCFHVDEGLRLCVVADGIGGHKAGEVASRTAVDAVVEHVRETMHAGGRGVEDTGAWPFGFEASLSTGGNLLRNAVLVANLQVLETAITTADCSGMGTTIVAALVSEETLSVAHVGDSRLYLLSGGRLRQLTQDDSWVAAVVAGDPDVDPASLQHHPMRNVLTSAVGLRAAAPVHVAEHDLRTGELFVMTTDGVHGVLDDTRMGRLLSEGGSPVALAADLVRAALARGSRDNCTALVARYMAG